MGRRLGPGAPVQAAVPNASGVSAQARIAARLCIIVPARCSRARAHRAQARYADSIESLVRNNIQKIKTDMANEVIDAGRFDMETTMAERRVTLESMLQARPRAAQTEP